MQESQIIVTMFILKFIFTSLVHISIFLISPDIAKNMFISFRYHEVGIYPARCFVTALLTTSCSLYDSRIKYVLHKKHSHDTSHWKLHVSYALIFRILFSGYQTFAFTKHRGRAFHPGNKSEQQKLSLGSTKTTIKKTPGSCVWKTSFFGQSLFQVGFSPKKWWTCAT